MHPEPGDNLETFFLPGSAGQLFCVYRGPADAMQPPETGVLYVPPFADEMNKARRQAAVQSHALALQGYGVLSVDLFGTGDSEGEFAAHPPNHQIADTPIS